LSAAEAPELSARYDEATRSVIEQRLGVDVVRALEASESLIAVGPVAVLSAGEADLLADAPRKTLTGAARVELIALLYAEAVAWKEIPPCKCDPYIWAFTWTFQAPGTDVAVGFDSLEIATQAGNERGGLRHHDFDLSRLDPILRRR
jgi:hypothetical protein